MKSGSLNPSQKRVLLILSLIGIAYFAIFILPNLQGARDANMLAVFETDEYAQYPNVIRMLTPGPTFYQSVRNFVVYLHYFYGYPFYFYSALTLLPAKLVLGANWTELTPVLVMILRQVINVLPMIVASLLLVWIQTRFRPAWLSIALFLLLLFVPALVVNNFWWHPDSLLVLFVVLTFFFLDRDDQRYGWNFYLAAVACGLATATKHLGLFFCLAIPLYLAWGWLNKKLTFRRAALSGLLFVLVMVAAIVFSNPLLLLPQERAEIIATQKMQWQQTTQGYWEVNLSPFFSWGKYPEDFRLHYGELFFVLLSFVGLGLGMLRKDRRLYHFLVLAWAAPFLYYFLVIAATRRTHYFLPVALPLFSCLINFFPPAFPDLLDRTTRSRARLSLQITGIARWAVALLIVVQAALFVWQDGKEYIAEVTRERDSASLAFFNQVDSRVLAKLENRKLLIFHDWKAYVPERPGWQIEMSWDNANYPYIQDLKPDVVLLQQENIVLFSKSDAVQNAINPGDMAALHQFYRDASQDAIQGYREVYSDRFGLAFVKESLYPLFR